MEPLIRVEPPGEKALEVLRRDAAVISRSIVRKYPLVLQKASGVNLWDVDGNRYLDFTAGIAVMNAGWNHPRVVSAVQEQAKYLSHGAFLDFCSEIPVRCAEELVRLLPDGLNRVYYANSGAESIEAAMKLARHHTGRNFFISFYRGFHGRTYGALSLTASQVIQRRAFGPFLPVVHVPYPDPYHPLGGDPATCDADVITYLEDTVFRSEVAPEEVAAIFVEPVLGEGGYVVPPPGFLPRLRRLCDEHGILLAADEVQSGCFRTGRFLASMHAGVTPDIVCLGKAIGGGLPLGVTVASEEVMDWPPGSHASTFGGNNLACAAALAVMALLREEGFGDRVLERGEYLMERLRELAERHPIVGDVRGLGLMAGMELGRDPTTKEPAGEERETVLRHAFEHGLVLLPAGESTIRFSPPLTIDEEEIDIGMDILDRVMEGF
ncbi:MAG: acetyl ornithine aminotransferase family protein [Methanoculleus sp.]|nr:acetyl ornithine aminotransferase family protein [Methanoculleus sp.]